MFVRRPSSEAAGRMKLDTGSTVQYGDTLLHCSDLEDAVYTALHGF